MNSTGKSTLWLSETNGPLYYSDAAALDNHVSLSFQSRSENVALARLIASGILSSHNMTLAELDEVKVAVSEAVSNAIIHGYKNDPDGWVELSFLLEEDNLTITVHDEGVGIENIEEAMRPNFSGNGRMGLGFAFMNSFMDQVEVKSAPLCGTTVILSKKIA